MKTRIAPIKRRIGRILILAGLSLLAMLLVEILSGTPAAHALPEYAARTGEACATCHVNPGGGGPRTLRGLLWSAQGQPDQVPQLGNIPIAPGVTGGMDLFDIACAACHGESGEGLFGMALAGSGLQSNKIRSTTLRGRERSGMPGFEGQFTDEQLDLLVEYVAGLSSGAIEPPPSAFPLPPAVFTCIESPGGNPCGGN